MSTFERMTGLQMERCEDMSHQTTHHTELSDARTEAYALVNEWYKQGKLREPIFGA